MHKLADQVFEAFTGYLKRWGDPVLARLKALEDRPIAKDGERGEKGEKGDSGERGTDGIQGATGEQGPAGKDGAIGEKGDTGANGRDGTDGRDGAPGPKGEKGDAGINGKDADPELVRAEVVKVFAEMPKPQDGRDGRDGPAGAQGAPGQRGMDGTPGRDGLSFDDFNIELDGRTFRFTLSNGDRTVTKEIKVPFPVDRGVFKSGQAYESGDVVTYGGSMWTALKDTSTSPPSDDWRLTVRRGKDGKDAS